ncbi:hypothetical protein QR680_007072 [Steinernema hermaphroditum]|uniref:Uncharacterized protein n=1 Tax=Steinernema hermaphroditum TaxID=289476 RepID=A0AA39HXJ0_9BILA|nr:hypothetical protein QR680_007072 [Steinernema hermaphroditum]
MARTLSVLFALVFAFATISAYVVQPGYSTYPYERNYDYNYGYYPKPYNYRGHYYGIRDTCRGPGCGNQPGRGKLESFRVCGYHDGEYVCIDY